MPVLVHNYFTLEIEGIKQVINEDDRGSSGCCIDDNGEDDDDDECSDDGFAGGDFLDTKELATLV